jgi:hypothetical protein
MKVYGDCSECDRPMRDANLPAVPGSGLIAYGAFGMCTTCYGATRREKLGAKPDNTLAQAEIIQHTAATNYGFLGKATPVELVRWVEDEIGWDYRIVKGIHRGHTDTHWQVEVLGEVVEYDRTVWEVTLP